MRNRPETITTEPETEMTPITTPLELDILIVDDSPANLIFFKKVAAELVEEPPRTAEDGEEAMKMIHDKKPDCILLDWMMPLKSGLDILKEIKADENYKDIPVLMLSAKAEGEDIVQALEAGAAGYLVKPVVKAKLKDKLLELLT